MTLAKGASAKEVTWTKQTVEEQTNKPSKSLINWMIIMQTSKTH